MTIYMSFWALVHVFESAYSTLFTSIVFTLYNGSISALVLTFTQGLLSQRQIANYFSRCFYCFNVQNIIVAWICSKITNRKLFFVHFFICIKKNNVEFLKKLFQHIIISFTNWMGHNFTLHIGRIPSDAVFAPANALSSSASGQSKRPNKQTDTLQISSPNSYHPHVTLPG